MRAVFSVVFMAACFLGANGAAQSASPDSCPQPEVQPTSEDVTLRYYRAICGVTHPKAIYLPSPDWPDVKLQIDRGSALLWVGVGDDGTVGDIKILQASAKEFGDKAVEAVRVWKFRPGMKDGHAVPVAMQITFDWELH